MNKVLNWYTVTLYILAVISVLASLYLLLTNNINITFYLFMLIIIVIVEVLPIKMPSGGTYSISSLLVLFITIHNGLEYGAIAIAVGACASCVAIHKNFRFYQVRVVVTIGMYIVSNSLAYMAWLFLKDTNIILAAALAAFVYELVNVTLLEGIFKVVYNEKMFTKWKEHLTETIVPVLVSSIVIPRLFILKEEMDFYISVLYTLFFLLIIIFFSRSLTQQIILRRSSAQSFISILEEVISPKLVGHGKRVGMIVETLLADFEYPKGKRNDLIQAAITHDIGKSLIPSHIFNKRGALTLSEERKYKEHSEKAVNIVKTMFTKETLTDWIYYHHERWDGKGFPLGLAGGNIPLESRIIAIGNELDHILSRHEDNDTILELLKEMSGSVLDPRLVEKIELHHIEEIRHHVQSKSIQESVKMEKEDDNFKEQNEPDVVQTEVGHSLFIQVKEGIVQTPNADIPIDFVQALTHKAIERQASVHETIQHNGHTFDVHVQPQENGEAMIFAHDLTPFINYRKQLEQKILESYDGVIAAVSQGKIKLHSIKQNVMNRLGAFVDEISIQNKSDVPKSREFIIGILEQYPTVITSMKIQLSVSEAVTNIIKHATDGKFSAYCHDDRLQLVISDKGSGIPLHEIPKTLLVSGYSSKRSLGKGFKMIENFSDGVHIYTSSEGTYILIEYIRQGVEKAIEETKEVDKEKSPIGKGS